MEPEDEKPELTTIKSGPTVVGIGASAGGFAALRQLFAHIPADCGIAFVVVVHLAPEHKSLLADLLQPSVKFPVRQVTETIPLEANNVYVIPPNSNISAVDTHLRLSALEERRRERAPIDHFFRTLAATHDGHSIGVVVTGTGSDGTLGLREIKAKGGVILVQDPNEAEFDGMPQSAISTGMVDRVLTLAEIAIALLRLAQTKHTADVQSNLDGPLEVERVLLPKVITILRARTDRDFSRYKTATLLRRIARRMQLNYIDSFARYVEFVRDQPEETRALADDLLINVTSFFRDSEVFEKLEQEIVPKIFNNKTVTDCVRVWSVGCATGEEAYSLAMLLLEEKARRAETPKIQIFASDLHKRSLEGAREGLYPGDIEADVSTARLQRFFRKENGGYRISKEVRDMVVFAPHNLLGDPPFSRLDLIACRNLLIYLDRSVQRDVIDLFHYALSPHGYLLLGSAETADANDLFRIEDKKLCMYEKRNVPGPETRLPVFPLTRLRKPGERPFKADMMPVAVPYNSVHQNLLERFAPPSILVGVDNRLVHLSDRAGRYLMIPGGEVTASVVRLVREELRVELQNLLQIARESKLPVDSAAIPVRFDGQIAPVVMHVRAAQELDQEDFVLVIFEEHQALTPETANKPNQPPGSGGSAESEARISALEQTISEARQQLQTIIEEYETSQEEMKAANEEMQSTNEELRSTMEELETSKEELQSINEELQTVNQENRHKVDELSHLSGDLQNLLASTDIATLFLDRDLRIMRFTPRLSNLFNVRITDRGRPISDLTHRLGYQQLREDAKAVLDRLVPIEREIEDDRQCWYLTRMLPYRSVEDRIEGVVITFTDITQRRRAEDALREQESRLRALSTAGHQLVYRMSPDWRYMYQMEGNNVLVDTSGNDESWAMNYLLDEDRSAVMAHVQRAVESKSVFELTHRVRRADGDFGWVLSRAVPIFSKNGEISEWFGSAVDITERKKTEAALQVSEEKYRMLFESIDEGFCIIEVLFEKDRCHDYRFEEVNPAFSKQAGLSHALGRTMRDLLPRHEEFWYETYGDVVKTGLARRFEHEAIALDRWFDVYAFPIGPPEAHRLALVFNDISERKRSDERQALLMGELNHRVKNTLATVQSIANQTLRNTTDPVAFADSFQARLQALSRAHSLLTRSSWESADVRQIVDNQVRVADKEESVEVSGPEALLTPQVTVALSLVLHELTTNARKYGALSMPSGHLQVRWKVLTTEPALRLDWTETGGPEVTVPEKRGFGSTLIEKSLAGVGGTATSLFQKTGLLTTIHLPLAPDDAIPAG